MARPSTPILSRERIRDAALELIDEDGLAEFSMRRLAGRLGVQAPSLYSHFAGRDDVFDAVANLLTRRVDTSGFASGDWRRGVQAWARSYRAALAAHPNAVPLVASGAGRREDYLAMSERVHAGLLSGGWPARHATEIAGAVKYLVIGAASTPFASGFSDDVQVYLDRYPALTQAHRLPELADEIDSESFELGLSCILVGLDRLHPTARAT